MDDNVLDGSLEDAPRSRDDRRRRKAVVRNVALLLWAAVIAFQTFRAVTEPTVLNIGVALAFVLLCLSVSAQFFVARWANNRHWRRLVARMHGSNYLAEAFNLPNRNYLMSELRREMPRARQAASHFFLVQISFDTFVEVRMRRGQDFCDRALGALAATLERVCRTEFLAYVELARFVILVNDASPQAVMRLLRTIPGAIPVSDGHTTWDVLVSARVLQYDLESLYASDLIRDLEDSAPLRRRDQPLSAEAA